MVFLLPNIPSIQQIAQAYIHIKICHLSLEVISELDFSMINQKQLISIVKLNDPNLYPT